MNILQILHNFPPVWYGGTEIYTLRLSQALRDQNVRSIVLTAHHDPAFEPFTFLRHDYSGIEVYRLNILEDVGNRFDNEVIQNRVSEILSQLNIDIVHIQHLLLWPLSLLYLGKPLKIPVVLSLNDFYLICHEIHMIRGRGDIEQHDLCDGPTTIKKCTECFFHNHPGRISSDGDFKNANEYFSARKDFIAGGLRSVDKILVPSEFARDIFLRSGIIPTGKLNMHPLGVPVFKRTEQVHKGVNFAFIGNVNALKGVDIMVKAFKKSDVKNAMLYIYGGGDVGWLEGLIGDNEDRIKYMGQYIPDDLEGIFKGIDCAIMPSMIECYGLSVREALSAGVPVITTDAGGLKDVIKDNVNGFVVEVGDIDAIARKIDYVVNNLEKVRKMGRSMKAPVSIKEDAAEMIGIYRELVQR